MCIKHHYMRMHHGIGVKNEPNKVRRCDKGGDSK